KDEPETQLLGVYLAFQRRQYRQALRQIEPIQGESKLPAHLKDAPALFSALCRHEQGERLDPKGVFPALGPNAVPNSNQVWLYLELEHDVPARLKLIRDTLKQRPRDAFWRYLLGLALLKVGETKQSIQVLEELTDCEQFETDVNFWQYLGEAHHKAGQRDKARAAWEKALRASPPTAEKDDRRRRKIEDQLKGL